MCDVVEIKGGKKYKLVPPDGGWGYMICLSTIISLTTLLAITPCFGLIFNDFLIELKMGSTSVALLNGLNGVSVAVAGYTAGPLSKIMSWRQLCLLASLLMTLSCIGTYFATTKFAFFLCQALQFTGIGYLYNISCTQINYYFLKRRLLSMTVTQTIPGLLTILAPQFFKWSLEEYGFRGTLVLMIGMIMQNFVAAMLLQPVAWHMKRVPISDDEEEDNLLLSKRAAMKTDDKDHGVVVVMKEAKTADKTHHCKNLVYDSETTEVLEKPKGIMQRVSDALDLSLFKKLVVVSSTFGVSMALFADVTFTMLLPQALFFSNWNESNVAWGLTLMSIGDVSTKIGMIVLNNCLMKLGYRKLYMIGLVLAVVSRIGMMWSKRRVATLVFLTAMGASRCLLNTLMPLVLSEVVPQSQYANVMGMYMLLFGCLCLLVGPVVGAIRDLTNSYATSFCILTSLYAIVLIFWSIEMCYMRNQRKEQRQKLKPKRSIK